MQAESNPRIEAAAATNRWWLLIRGWCAVSSSFWVPALLCWFRPGIWLWLTLISPGVAVVLLGEPPLAFKKYGQEPPIHITCSWMASLSGSFVWRGWTHVQWPCCSTGSFEYRKVTPIVRNVYQSLYGIAAVSTAETSYHHKAINREETRAAYIHSRSCQEAKMHAKNTHWILFIVCLFLSNTGILSWTLFAEASPGHRRCRHEPVLQGRDGLHNCCLNASQYPCTILILV